MLLRSDSSLLTPPPTVFLSPPLVSHLHSEGAVVNHGELRDVGYDRQTSSIKPSVVRASRISALPRVPVALFAAVLIVWSLLRSVTALLPSFAFVDPWKMQDPPKKRSRQNQDSGNSIVAITRGASWYREGTVVLAGPNNVGYKVSLELCKKRSRWLTELLSRNRMRPDDAPYFEAAPVVYLPEERPALISILVSLIYKYPL